VPVVLVIVLLAGRTGAGGRAAWGEEAEPVDAARELRRAARADLGLAERTTAAVRALTAPTPPPGTATPDLWVRAATSLLGHDALLPIRLLVRSLHEGVGSPAAWADARRAFAALREKGSATPWFAELEVVGLLLGRPGPPGDLPAFATADPAVREALTLKLGARLLEGEPDALAARLAQAWPTLAALEQAHATDEAGSRAGLEAVVALGEAALPLLTSRAALLAKGVPPGLLAEGLDVLALLGQLGRREATPVLVACLESMQGWVRYGAATALADLADPAAAVALARQVAYAGDPFRGRESWDYPGTSETTVPPEGWASVEYYVIDVAACDALLTLGARGAAGWLVKHALHPGRRNLRIRVPQDALDVLRRHLPKAPLPELLVDGSLPERFALWEALEAWWSAHKDDADLLGRTFPSDDPGFVPVADALARRLTEPKVLELMIAKDSCELLGDAITPALVRAVANARPGAKTELARALARTRDPHAVPTLLEMLNAPQGFVRAAAAEVLDVFARRDPQVVPALLRALDDPDCGLRVAAMKGLVGAPVRADVLAAVRAHDEAQHAARCGPDATFGWTRSAVLLVQEGAGHASTLVEALGHADRVVRRTAWDLLRMALGLPDHLFDPLPAPGTPEFRALDPERLARALATRRGR
jgi:HEAT repeat protein